MGLIRPLIADLAHPRFVWDMSLTRDHCSLLPVFTNSACFPLVPISLFGNTLATLRFVRIRQVSEVEEGGGPFSQTIANPSSVKRTVCPDTP